MTTTIQDIFEMRKNGQFEQAYAAVLPMYREHHGHYTTLCMFWTATDVLRLRLEAGRFAESEQILASLRNLYPNLQDKDWSAARTLNRLALLLATKEQEQRKLLQYQNLRGSKAQDDEANGDGARLAWEVQADPMQFSLLDYMADFGVNYLSEDDWQTSEWNGHVVPSMGTKIISRIYHEVSDAEGKVQSVGGTVQSAEGNVQSDNKDRLEAALEMVKMGLQRAPRNKHLLRYEANLLYRLGEKQRAVALYRQLIERSRESYLFSELAGMIDDQQERAALLSKAIMNQRTEVFAQKDRLTLAGLLKELFPQNAAFELQQVVKLRDSLGQRMNRTIQGLQQELADIVPVTMADQREFYQRMMKGFAYAA